MLIETRAVTSALEQLATFPKARLEAAYSSVYGSAVPRLSLANLIVKVLVKLVDLYAIVDPSLNPFLDHDLDILSGIPRQSNKSPPVSTHVQTDNDFSNHLSVLHTVMGSELCSDKHQIQFIKQEINQDLDIAIPPSSDDDFEVEEEVEVKHSDTPTSIRTRNQVSLLPTKGCGLPFDTPSSKPPRRHTAPLTPDPTQSMPLPESSASRKKQKQRRRSAGQRQKRKRVHGDKLLKEVTGEVILTAKAKELREDAKVVYDILEPLVLKNPYDNVLDKDGNIRILGRKYFSLFCVAERLLSISDCKQEAAVALSAQVNKLSTSTVLKNYNLFLENEQVFTESQKESNSKTESWMTDVRTAQFCLECCRTQAHNNERGVDRSSPGSFQRMFHEELRFVEKEAEEEEHRQGNILRDVWLD